MKRRQFLTGTALGLGALGLGLPLLSAAKPMHGERRLALFNLHTGESLDLAYWADGGYVTEHLAQIDHILRDFRTGESMAIDPRVLDYLAAVAVRLDLNAPLQIVSGFRSSRTNDMLHKRDGDGVAKNSLHLRGQAVDIKAGRVPLETLQKAALSVSRGGVGYYPGQFVHLDCGPVRHWTKKHA